jgi:hypothetical protein
MINTMSAKNMDFEFQAVAANRVYWGDWL